MEGAILRSEEILKGHSGHALVTIAIGDQHYAKWKENCLPSWMLYAKYNDLGIVVYTENLISRENLLWKKPQWQKMLLPERLSLDYENLKSVCYLDTDILINPFAPNVFEELRPGYVASVSVRNNLPYPLEPLLKRLVLLRREYIDRDYPLDSGIFASLETLYKENDLPPQNDEICTGVLLFNVSEFAGIMKEWFYLFPPNIKTITNDGEQTHLNYLLISNRYLHTISYDWQTIWSYESAWYYPHLFENKFENLNDVHNAIRDTLFRTNFLHFAGSWPESTNWQDSTFSMSNSYLDFQNQLQDFNGRTVTGKPIGKYIPKKDS